MKNKKFLTAGISGIIAVSFGALGAHYLKSQVTNGLITEQQVQSFDTGVKYQMYHTLAILILAFADLKNNSKFILYAYRCFISGIILFSGSIYILSTKSLFNIEGLKWLGPITPIGGLLFISGWIFISLYGLNHKTGKNE